MVLCSCFCHLHHVEWGGSSWCRSRVNDERMNNQILYCCLLHPVHLLYSTAHHWHYVVRGNLFVFCSLTVFQLRVAVCWFITPLKLSHVNGRDPALFGNTKQTSYRLCNYYRWVYWWMCWWFRFVVPIRLWNQSGRATYKQERPIHIIRCIPEKRHTTPLPVLGFDLVISQLRVTLLSGTIPPVVPFGKHFIQHTCRKIIIETCWIDNCYRIVRTVTNGNKMLYLLLH